MEHTGLFEKSNLVLKSQEFRWTCTLNFAQSDELPVEVEEAVEDSGSPWAGVDRGVSLATCGSNTAESRMWHTVLTKIEFPVVLCDFCSQTSEGIYGDANFMGPHSSFLEALDQDSAFMPCSEAKARFRFRILWHLQQVYLPPRRHLTCFFFSALWDAKSCWIAFLISIPNTFSSRRA